MIGLWRRLVLQRPGEAADETTVVLWLQGPRFFIDLRQAPQRPSFDGVRCLADLAPEHIAWLSAQEGFAGPLHVADDIALWERRIDFQPKSPVLDRARIALDGDVLHEDGTEVPYYEKWARERLTPVPALGLKLCCPQTGRLGFLVRVGRLFMHARDRATPLPGGANLSAVVSRTPDIAAKRALIDCEISFGEISEAGWVIQRSTLPFRIGQDLAPLHQGPDRVETGDLANDGTPRRRAWQVVERDEAIGSLTAKSGTLLDSEQA